MHRIITFIFILLYTTSVSGAVFHLHFCGTYLQSVSFAGEKHDGCCCGEKEMKSNCCEDKVAVFKSDQVHEQSELNAAINYNGQFSPVFYQELTNLQYTQNHARFIPGFHSPPIGQHGTAILIRNCVFRI